MHVIRDIAFKASETYIIRDIKISYGDQLSKTTSRRLKTLTETVKDLIVKITGFHKILPIRTRYLFTRNNRLRLRYSALVSGVFVLFFTSAANSYLQTGPVDAFNKNASIFDGTEYPRYDYERDVAESLKSHVGGGLPDIKNILKARGPVSLELKVQKGQTIAGLLQEAGAGGGDAYEATNAISQYKDLRKIMPGQEVNIRLEPDKENSGSMILTDLMMPIDKVNYITLKRGDEGFESQVNEKEVNLVKRAGQTTIQTSLYGSALRSGIPEPVIAKLVHVYSWDVDFQRDIRRGDKIDVMYEAYQTEDGDVVRYGNVTFANLSVRGRDIPLYRFEMDNGKIDYFEPNGQSIKKTLMKTPVDGARISSGYGMRKHPILGYNKMHKGVDFAAPTGTPIYAAGDGIIEKAERFGAYGNFVRIRHNSKLKTAYGHLHKYAKNIRPGTRVEQGDVIGYVGSTGRSTGPHLHYEVMVNGEQVNPGSVDLPTGEQLIGNDMKRFQQLVRSANQLFASLAEEKKFAASSRRDDSDKSG